MSGPRPLVPGGSGLAQLRATPALLADAGDDTVVCGAVPFDVAEPGALRVGTAEFRNVGAIPVARARTAPLLAGSRPVPEPARYRAAVAEALRRIETGALAKVVLARSLELTALSPWSVPQLAGELSARNPMATTVAVPVDDPVDPAARWLVGASPELLLRRRGPSVSLRPLAGSIPRSADPAEDARRGEQLLGSDKDRREHAVVVEAILEALRPFCRQINAPEPELHATPALWHLATPVTGLLIDREVTSTHLVAALHPTPAVGGTPRSEALSVIREIEGLDRGCYAGAVGWQDGDGDGEWVVAVRCGEVSGRRLRIFAGAGIVAGSDPAAELAETGVKMRTMLDALSSR
ncbi:isochorismate synthase MenF [Kineococcus gynurae]|uniref:isochorismate synthase n=1 Tax=Kineococcus gynurae TaxID=452979 RepID=A0ABV5LTB9_9ACTN